MDQFINFVGGYSYTKYFHPTWSFSLNIDEAYTYALVSKKRPAVRKSGNRLSNRPKATGLYRRYRELAMKKSPMDKVKDVATIAAAAASCIGLVEHLLNFWSYLPKGPGPEMPDDYYYLKERIEPTYPKLPKRIIYFSKGANNADWALARRIFDSAHEIAESESGKSSTVKARLQQLESSANQLLDTMQPSLREMLFEDLESSD
jgi:hypothetical protein